MDSSDLLALATALEWLRAGHRVTLATVVQTWGSSPRPPGAWAAFCDDGRVAGSVSGGCIEDDLADRARRACSGAASGQTLPDIVQYGVSKEEAARFGLPCGGSLRLVLEAADAEVLAELQQRLKQRERMQRVLDLPSGRSTLLPDLAPSKGNAPRCTLSADDHTLRTRYGPSWRLLIIGAGQISQHLAAMAQALDYAVTVCDPREAYRASWAVAGTEFTSERPQGRAAPRPPPEGDEKTWGGPAFSHEMPDDAVAALQPDAHTAIVALTHDPKLDDLALIDALQSDAFYIGALGSRLNQSKRKARLQEHFELTDAQLARLHGPVGLAIGSRTPGEIAVSILAEMTACKNGVVVPARGD